MGECIGHSNSGSGEQVNVRQRLVAVAGGCCLLGSGLCPKSFASVILHFAGADVLEHFKEPK